MSPPWNNNTPPKFAEELLDSQFEDFCCALFAREPGIKSCIRYGERGQRQYGIDLLAEVQTGGNEVAQCKCQREFDADDVRNAADKFLSAQEHWKNWGITRFVLIAACSVRDAKIQDEKEKQRQRFGKEGILFELWGDERLTEKLVPHPDVVDVHIGAAWVRKICGPNFATELVSRVVNEARSRGTLGDVLTDYADGERSEASRKFAAIRETARSGRFRSALEAIEEYRVAPHWTLLDVRTQSRGLRLAASLYIDACEDLDRAQELLREAKRLSPGENYQLIDGAIAYRQKGCQEALKIIEQPTDVDAWNMKLALHVETGNYSGVLADVQAAPFKPNGNTWRISSVAALLNGDLPTAQEHARLAADANPSWFIVRLHAAKMKYLGTLLTHFPMMRHLSWPIPPKRQYLRSDDESLLVLDSAGDEFEELLKLVDGGDEERPLIEGWRLACLANHPGRRREATQYVQRLIHDNPAHLPAAVWAMERGIDIDLRMVPPALMAGRLGAMPTHDDLQASCAILIASATPQEAVALVDERRSDFERLGALFFWRLLKAQIAEDAGQSDLAARVEAEEPDEANRLQIRTAVLRIRSRKTGDEAELCRELVDAFRRDASSDHLFAAFEGLVQAGQGQDAVVWTDDLLREFPTPPGVTLALQANFDAGNFQKCLQISESFAGCFPDQRLPSRIIRLKAECLKGIGQIAEAKALAESLARNEVSTPSLAPLFYTQSTLGDFKGCVITVRTLLHREDVAPLGLLQMAAAVQAEDRELAIDCWRKAIGKGIHGGNETAAAVDLAFRLGLDDEAAPLMPKFWALAHQAHGPVRAFSLDEVKEMMRAQAEQHAHASKLFNEAQVPAHLLAMNLNAPLAGILTENMRTAAADGDLLRVFPALIRPGTRADLWGSVPLKPGTICMDITALYVAEEIGVLDIIERVCAPIFISASVPELLQAEINRITPHQPAIQQPRLDLLRLVDSGALKTIAYQASKANSEKSQYAQEMGGEWEFLLSEARQRGGVLCDYLPPSGQSGLPLVVSNEDARHLVTCGDLVGALEQLGEISAAQALEAVRKLGESSNSFNQSVSLLPGTFVLLDAGMAEQLARAQVIDGLTRVFDVTATQDSIERTRAEVAAFQRATELAARLKRSSERLTTAIVDGVFKTFRRVAHFNGTDRNEPHASLFERCLFDLTAASEAGVSVAWVDDRFLLRFNNVGSIRVAGISDVLKTLRNQGYLTPSQYITKLLDLRARNARYLPVEEEEIWEQISAAQVVRGNVFETRALAILRRYLAACFTDEGRLHPPVRQGQKVEPGEFVWVIRTLKAVADTIAKLWATSSLSEAQRTAKADWLIHNLYAPYHGIIEAVTKEACNGGGVFGQASSILMLLGTGFALSSPWQRKPEDKDHPRARYYAWLADRMIDPCIKTEPAIAITLAKEAKRLFIGKRKVKGGAMHRKVMRGLALRVFLDLPRSLQEAMDLDVDTRKWLGIRLGGRRCTITVCGKQFAGEHFWKSLAMVANGQTATVRSSDTNEEFKLSPTGKDGRGVWVNFEGPGIPSGRRIRDEQLGLLSASKDTQRAVLLKHREWIDRSEPERLEAIDSIVRLKDPAKRMFSLEDIRDNSAAWFYRTLSQKVRSSRSVTTTDCLPPSVESLCAHMRLSMPEFANADAIPQAALRLHSDVGLGEAIERLASLPVIMSDHLVSACVALNEAEFKAVIAILRRKLRSPVARLHLFHLMAARGVNDHVWLLQAQLLRDEIFSDQSAREGWKAFRRILCWVHEQMEFLDRYRCLHGAAKLVLVWLHAGRLFETLSLAGADAECLLRAFGIWTLAQGGRIEEHDVEYYCDAMHSRFAGRLPVAVRGFGAILATLPTNVGCQLKLSQIPWRTADSKIEASTGMLLRDNTVLTNCHRSYLGSDSRELMLHALEAEAVNGILPASPTQLIIASIEGLEKEITDMPAWRLLAWALDDSPLADDMAFRVNALLERGIQERVFTSDEDEGLLVFAARRGQWNVSEELKQKLISIVLERASRIKGEQGEVNESSKGLDVILNCLAGIAVVHGDERATHQNFHRLLARLVREWPDAGASLSGVCGWPAYLPTVCHAGYWEAALTIRAAKGPSR